MWKSFDDDTQDKEGKKWYIGKYVGRRRPSSNQTNSSNTNQTGGDQDSDNDSAGNYENYINPQDDGDDRASISGKSVNSTDEGKREKLFAQVVRKIRNKVIARQLIGTIFVYRVSGFVSTAMRCKITEETYQKLESESLNGSSRDSILTTTDNGDIDGNYLRAISMTDTILDSLERRSLSWANVDYNEEVMLTRGAKMGIQGPLLGIVGYNISIEISATAQSLIASRRRFEAKRTMSMSGRQSSFSARAMSFSMFSSSSKNPANAAAASVDPNTAPTNGNSPNNDHNTTIDANSDDQALESVSIDDSSTAAKTKSQNQI